MRYSSLFLPTRREDPADAEVISHKLLVRGGYMRMLTRGVYSFLPLGLRVLRNIETIIREEMDRAGAQEVLLPGVQPAELWQESGRWDAYGPALLRFRDRKGSSFCLGPTHEEVVTDLVRGELRSYRQLPMNVYQIQTKFRDEARPRAGLMRGREFVMKDAYSFDANVEDAKKSYTRMRDAYDRIFTRLGLTFRAVEADTGDIGGSLSHEYQVLAFSGEDRVVACDACGYAANTEKAEVVHTKSHELTNDHPAMQRVETPKMRTVEEVTSFLGIEAHDLIKTLLFVADGQPVAVLVRGDHEVNDVKVRVYLGSQTVELADEATVRAVTQAPVGFAGPVGIGVRVIADQALCGDAAWVVGGNAADEHITGVVLGRDAHVESFADLRLVSEGDACPRCGGDLTFYRGIEVGHVFYLGTKYSEALGATILGEDGTSSPVEMGCYGIGVTRIMAAAIEQNHDEHGICWPVPIAPFQAHLLTLGRVSQEMDDAASQLVDELRAHGVDVLWDDRDERPAVKFKDADLIGVPLRLTLGNRGLRDGVLEVKWRTSSEVEKVPLNEAANHIATLLRAQRARIE